MRSPVRGVLSSGLTAAQIGALAAAALGVPVTFSASIPDPAPAAPRTILGSPREIGHGLPDDFEPSGAAWQSRLQRLFLVGDEGAIASMDADGGSVRTWSMPGDLEAICVADPKSNRVYIAVEWPAAIVEFDFVEGRALRTFPIAALDGDQKNKGIEALTFVPDADDREGGFFWLGLQSDGSIHVLSLPVRSKPASTAVREVRSFTPLPGLSDLSDLDWDPSTGTVWAIFDRDDVLVRLDRSGAVRERALLPGRNQEGIAVVGDRVFIAEDSRHHRVVSYRTLGRR